MGRTRSKDGNRKLAPGSGINPVTPATSSAAAVPGHSSENYAAKPPVSPSNRLYGVAITLLRTAVALAVTILVLKLGYAVIVYMKFPDTGRVPSRFVPFASDLRPGPGTGWTKVSYNAPYSTFFIAPLNGLSCIAIELSTQGGVGTGASVDWKLERLEPDQTLKPLRSGSISTDIRDTEILDIDFSPVWDSADNRFRLTLSSAKEGQTALIPMWPSSDRNVLSSRQAISFRNVRDIAPITSGNAGTPFVFEFEADADRLDGVAIGLPAKEPGDRFRGSFVDWSLYDTAGPTPFLGAAGAPNDYDTMAAEEWRISFPPFAA